MALKAIVGGTVFDGTGGALIPDGVVLVEDDKILAVGKKVEVAIPDDAEVIFTQGWHVLPGLIDAHNHLGTIDPSEPGIDFEAEEQRLEKEEQVELESLILAIRHGRHQLRDGVTTMRTMGEVGLIDVQYKRAFEAGTVPGPRTLVSGLGITTSHGHGASVSVAADGPDEVRRAVRANLAAGADVIKLFINGGGSTAPDIPFLTREEIETAVEEAHRAGKKVAAHVIQGVGIDYALEADVDTLEHALVLTDEQIELIREKGTWIVETNTWPWEYIPPYGRNGFRIGPRDPGRR